MHAAAINGCALAEPQRDESWTTFLLLVRYRRDLVRKVTTLRHQVPQALDAAWPGFTGCFQDLWLNRAAGPVFRHFPSPAAVRAAGLDGLADCLDRQGVRYQRRSLARILAWAGQAPEQDVAAATHHRLALAWDDDRARKAKEIKGLGRELCALLAATPSALLLTCPGLNVVAAADLAGELGPIGPYASAKAISGRAGLRPSRSQSGRVDQSGGPLRRRCHRPLRGALPRAADSLLTSHPYFRRLAGRWAEAGRDPRWARVKVASRLCRILDEMVAGRKVFCHPKSKKRHYLLDKLIAFHRKHGGTGEEVERDLGAALGQLPATEYEAEARPPQLRTWRRGGRGLEEILPKVLARLGAKKIQSRKSGERAPAS